MCDNCKNTDTTLDDLVDSFRYIFGELPTKTALDDLYKTWGGSLTKYPDNVPEDAFAKAFGIASTKPSEKLPETPVESSKDPSVKLSNNLERGLIEIDLPGYKKSDIKITADFKYIFVNVSGTRGAKTYKFKLTETSDVPKISSKMEDGVLTIVVPVKESSKPIDIFVN
jgi:HSP20 family molecular chaperone IbpA